MTHTVYRLYFENTYWIYKFTCCLLPSDWWRSRHQRLASYVIVRLAPFFHLINRPVPFTPTIVCPGRNRRIPIFPPEFILRSKTINWRGWKKPWKMVRSCVCFSRLCSSLWEPNNNPNLQSGILAFAPPRDLFLMFVLGCKKLLYLFDVGIDNWTQNKFSPLEIIYAVKYIFQM